jgi:hypothetical protein
MAAFDNILQRGLGNSGLNTPIVPDDYLLGKATLSPFGTWVYSDIILSLRPTVAEVDLTKSVKVADSAITTGDSLATQIKRTYKNIADENYLDGDPDSIRLQQAIVKVDLQKVYSTTTVAGRSDTVVEYSSRGSYNIDVNFNVSSAWANVMPEKAIKKMVKILGSPNIISVSGRFLNFFEIDKIFITGYTMPQRAGYVNQQAGFFSAISVTDNSILASESSIGNERRSLPDSDI